MHSLSSLSDNLMGRDPRSHIRIRNAKDEPGTEGWHPGEIEGALIGVGNVLIVEPNRRKIIYPHPLTKHFQQQLTLALGGTFSDQLSGLFVSSPDTQIFFRDHRGFFRQAIDIVTCVRADLPPYQDGYTQREVILIVK